MKNTHQTPRQKKNPNTELFRRQKSFIRRGRICWVFRTWTSQVSSSSGRRVEKWDKGAAEALCFALQVCYSELAGSFVFSARHTRSGAAPNRTGGLPASLDTSPGWETIIQRQCWWHGSWHLSDTLIRRRGGSPVARCWRRSWQHGIH